MNANGNLIEYSNDIYWLYDKTEIEMMVKVNELTLEVEKFAEFETGGKNWHSKLEKTAMKEELFYVKLFLNV